MSNKRWILSLGSLLFAVVTSPTWAQSNPITAGPNMGSPQNPVHIQVDWDSSQDHWRVDEELIFDPHAPPMEKWFMTPPTSPTNPYPPGTAFPVWENFLLHPLSLAVLDWHEVIHTPGWEWRYYEYNPDPTDPNYEPLITRDGAPWPWKHQPPPATGGDPATMLWVEFPPIEPGHILDVHKWLVWMGDPNPGGIPNTNWGDNMDDQGNTLDESMIAVWEYPTPEPSSILLVALGALALAGVRRRRA